MVDKFDVKVYAYQATGQRDLASDFDLDPDNEWPSGITFANDRFYVVDDEDDKVYAYQATGQRDSASDFDLNPDNDDARGITFANDRFYVVDDEDDKVYAYSADVPPLGFSESGSATRSIPENLPGGINVGVPVSAVGGDAVDVQHRRSRCPELRHRDRDRADPHERRRRLRLRDEEPLPGRGHGGRRCRQSRFHRRNHRSARPDANL